MKKIIHGWKLSKNTNVCKNIGNNMDDIIHGMWSGNQGFREGVKIHDSTHPKELKSFQFYQFLLPTKSKHLKGRLGPSVGNVTFLDQWRSVGTPCW